MADEPHLIKSFDQELRPLRDMMIEMGGIVENQVTPAAVAIMDRDSTAASRVVEEDPGVDALGREVEQLVIRILALRQPVAGDLRQAVAALKSGRPYLQHCPSRLSCGSRVSISVLPKSWTSR